MHLSAGAVHVSASIAGLMHAVLQYVSLKADMAGYMLTIRQFEGIYGIELRYTISKLSRRTILLFKTRICETHFMRLSEILCLASSVVCQPDCKK